MTSNPFWIQTHTPRGRFDLSAPRAEDVRIEDIAYSLSRLCRFTGHCNRFYSVAEHSIYAAEIVAETHPEWALAALLHDAEEAYIGDISSPLKALIRNYVCGPAILGSITDGVEMAIEERFRLFDGTTPQGSGPYLARRDAIKAADLTMLATERRDLMPEPPDGDWFASTGVQGYAPRQGWMIPHVSGHGWEGLFLHRFRAYGGER